MLYIVATPIGNLNDVSPRTIQILRSSDIIACEDTRRTRILLSHFNIPRPETIISYRQQTEQRAGKQLIKLMEAGKTVALCTDGGYPGISDPGYKLIQLAIEHEIKIEVIPGASAVTMALLLSGLPSSSYTFKGYPPRKNGPMRRFFENEKHMPHTLIIFESPFRIAKTLKTALDVLGNRPCAVCVELTKKFEKVFRGHLDYLEQYFSEHKTKGEVSIVIAGNNKKLLSTNITQRRLETLKNMKKSKYLSQIRND